MTLQAIYISAATQHFSSEELAELLAKARENNTQNGVSGLLVYHQGSFLQILEGPAQAVEDTLDIIASDPRHTNVQVLLRDHVDEPEYEEWSMGFVDPTGAAQVIEGFVGYNGKLDAMTMDPTRAKKIVRKFKDGLWRQKLAA